MTSEHQVIVTALLAEKGKKYDTDKKCIGSYERSIVFLPADVKPGEIVRVSLHEVTEKKDSRGMVMYFARHAPTPISDDALQQIRGEAKVLDTMSNFDEETALALLRARHGTVVDVWKGYRHYYLDESGAVYASIFSPATLSLFEHLKRGTGLTEPLLWILGGMKPTEDSLYRKREKGEDIDWRFSVPPLGDAEVAELEEKVAGGRLLLSDTLIEMRSGTLHSEGWEDQLFAQATWPTLPAPDFGGGDDVPNIVEHEYGKGLDGQSLLGYAVFGPSDSAPVWHKHHTEAEEAHQAAVTKLAELRQTWHQRDELKPQIEELNVRREWLGLSALACERDIFKVGWYSYEYTEDNLAQFEQETIDREAAESRTAMETAQREAEERAEAEAAAEREHLVEAGCLTEFTCVHERGHGKTHRQCWVIDPDGTCRDPDTTNRDGSVWDLVRPEEIALMWEKGSNAAPHEFTVCQLMQDPTDEQLLQIGLILEGLEEQWKDARGLASDEPSPSVGEGWLHPETGLSLTATLRDEKKSPAVEEPTEADSQGSSVPGKLGASRAELDALANWFNKGKC